MLLKSQYSVILQKSTATITVQNSRGRDSSGRMLQAFRKSFGKTGGLIVSRLQRASRCERAEVAAAAIDGAALMRVCASSPRAVPAPRGSAAISSDLSPHLSHEPSGTEAPPGHLFLLRRPLLRYLRISDTAERSERLAGPPRSSTLTGVGVQRVTYPLHTWVGCRPWADSACSTS